MAKIPDRSWDGVPHIACPVPPADTGATIRP